MNHYPCILSPLNMGETYGYDELCYITGQKEDDLGQAWSNQVSPLKAAWFSGWLQKKKSEIQNTRKT